MKKRFFAFFILALLVMAGISLTENKVLLAGDPIIITQPPTRGPVPTTDKPTKKKLAVISNFDLERNSSAFTV
jgi:hypothetical protein